MNNSIAQDYLEKRHADTLKKLDDQRFAKQQQEKLENTGYPKICKKSNTIVRNMSGHTGNFGKESVFNRLTDEKNVNMI